MLLKEHIKNTLILALPVSIGQLGHIMMGVVDSVMVGSIGSVPLAASSLVNSLFFLVLTFGIGMTLAITPIVAIAKGGKKNDECGIVLRQALIANTFFSILLTAIIFLGADFIPLLNQPEEVAEKAVSYLKILGLSILPFMLFQNHRQFLEGISHVKPPMIIAILANVVNAFLNWILIFGNLGAPALGLDGAGWATFSTRCLMALALVLYVTKSPLFKKYDPSFNYRNINFPVIKKIISIGLPTGFQYFWEIAAFSFAAVMIGWMGTTQLAAHQIAISMASVTYMIILGISAAGTIRVGNAVGKKNISETRRAGFTAVSIAASVMFVFGVLFIILRNFLPSLYINDIEVINLASSLLIVAAFFQIFDGVQATSAGVLRGLTDVKIPLFIIFISYWIIGIPLGYILGFKIKLGAVGIWIGLLTGLFVVAFLLTLRFNKQSRKQINF